MSYRWKEMAGQREEGYCEIWVNDLTSSANLKQIIYREEKKVEAKNNVDDKKNESINYGFILYL